MRLVRDDGSACSGADPHSLTRLLATAHRYWHTLRSGDIDITRLARQEKVSNAWVARVLRLAFLSPEVTATLVNGTYRARIDGGRLLTTGAIAPRWSEQRARFLPDRAAR